MDLQDKRCVLRNTMYEHHYDATIQVLKTNVLPVRQLAWKYRDGCVGEVLDRVLLVAWEVIVQVST